MSKTTKIIAGLGVVAGLGVAALPIASFAAETSGNAQVNAVVDSAIAIEISGNSDDSTAGQWVDANPTGVKINGVTWDTTANSGAGASLIQNTTPSSSTAHLTQNSVVAGQTSDSAATDGSYNFGSLIKVTTNATGGYNLNVKTATGAPTALTSAANDTIPVVGSAGTLTAGTAGWGLKTTADYSIEESAPDAGDGVAADIKNDKWYAIGSSNQLIRPAVTSDSGYSQQETQILYGVATAAAQPTGTYTTTLTYTATTAN